MARKFVLYYLYIAVVGHVVQVINYLHNGQFAETAISCVGGLCMLGAIYYMDEARG